MWRMNNSLFNYRHEPNANRWGYTTVGQTYNYHKKTVHDTAISLSQLNAI